MNDMVLIERFIANKRYITGALSCLLIVCASAFLFFSKKRERRAEAYSAFLSNLEAFERGEEMDEALYSSLIQTLPKFPSVRPQAEERIAQKLIEIGQGKRATTFVDKALKRIASDAPSFAAFGQTALAIENKEYAKALEETKRLYEELPKDTTLALYTLLRKASLESMLGRKAEESKTWADLKKLLGLEQDAPSSAARSFLAHFSARDISLADYIRRREAQLK